MRVCQQVDIGDCNRPWWTAPLRHDSVEDQAARASEFLAFARYNGHASAVYVGHSLLWRGVCRRLLAASPQLVADRPDLAARLRDCKLGNAATLALTLRWRPLPQAPQALEAAEEKSAVMGGAAAGGAAAVGAAAGLGNATVAAGEAYLADARILWGDFREPD